MRNLAILPALSLALFLGSCGDRSASIDDSERAEAITAFAKSLVAKGEVPGLAIAVIRDGKTFQALTEGVADVAANTPVNGDTPFQLASTSKIFSSTGVLLLVADGRFRLDDTIGRHLPDLPETWRPVTIRQLLSHTSGLPDIAVRPGELELVAGNWPSALKTIATKPLESEPGRQWAYNQTNYALLLRLIERISGERFETFVNRRMFAPLGMRNTFFPTAARRCATNYDRASDGRPVVRDLSFPAYVRAAGGLCSSLNDMARWAVALQQNKLLPANLSNLAMSPVMLVDGSKLSLGGSASYGLGWAIDTNSKHGWAGHSGGNSTAFRRYPADKLAVIVLHNGMANPDLIADRLARTMIETEKGGGAQADLWDAAMAGDAAGINAALDSGADVNALDTRSNPNGRRPLNWAASRNHGQAVQLLIKRGAEVNGQNLSGFSALHHAAEENATEAAQVLLAAGANRAQKTKAGSTAADVARSNGHDAIAQMIDRTPSRR